jgi:hypothetical protein
LTVSPSNTPASIHYPIARPLVAITAGLLANVWLRVLPHLLTITILLAL